MQIIAVKEHKTSNVRSKKKHILPVRSFEIFFLFVRPFELFSIVRTSNKFDARTCSIVRFSEKKTLALKRLKKITTRRKIAELTYIFFSNYSSHLELSFKKKIFKHSCLFFDRESVKLPQELSKSSAKIHFFTLKLYFFTFAITPSNVLHKRISIIRIHHFCKV